MSLRKKIGGAAAAALLIGAASAPAFADTTYEMANTGKYKKGDWFFQGGYWLMVAGIAGGVIYVTAHSTSR